MKSLLLIITLFLSSSMFSQSTNALEVLEDSFKSDTIFYTILLKSNLSFLSNNNDNQTIVFNTSNDKISNYQQITYSFKEKSLTSYTILFKDGKNLSINEFCSLYGDCDEKIVNGDIYTWGANISRLYAKFIASTNELIIGLK